MSQFKKSFIWNTIGTSFNAFNSLFFMIIVTRINGVENAGIFTLAFSTACIMYVIGLYAGRIYQVTEPDQTITNKDYIINRIITTSLMIILVAFFCIIKGYTLYKATIFILLTIYKALEAFCDTFYGILQKNEKLDKVGKSLVLKSIISVILFMLVDYATKNLVFTIIAIIITNILITIFYDIKNSKEFIETKVKYNKNNIKKIFKLGFFTFIISFLGMYILNAPKYSIDNYLTESYQTIFGIIVMPATVMGLVAQFLIHPYLNKIMDVYEDRNLKALKKMIFKLVLIIGIFGMLASILAYLLGPEVLGGIYGIDLNLYRVNLVIIIIASTLYTVGVIYSSVLTTVRDTFSQFIIYIIISIFAFIISNLFTQFYELNGATYAYLSIMFLQFSIYIVYSNIKLKRIFKEDRVKI